MYEVYVKCPATGEPFYAGVREESWDGTTVPNFLKNSMCPICGVKHEWRSTSVVLEIPLDFPTFEPIAPQVAPDMAADLWQFDRAVGAK